MLLAPKTGLSQQHHFANRGTEFFFHGKEKPTSSPELFRATQGKDMLQHNAKHWANQNSIIYPSMYPPTHLNCWGVKICIPYYSRMFMHSIRWWFKRFCRLVIQTFLPVVLCPGRWPVMTAVPSAKASAIGHWGMKMLFTYYLPETPKLLLTSGSL